MGKRVFAAAVTLLALGVFGVSGASAVEPTVCKGTTLSGKINGNVTAKAGCRLSGATVKGNVTVAPGGTLVAEYTTVTGNVQSNMSGEVALVLHSTVDGNVQIAASTVIDIEEGAVGGNVQIINGLADIEVVSESIGGSVTVHDRSRGANYGLVSFVADTIAGFLQVVGNDLAGSENEISVAGNTVGRELAVNGNTSSVDIVEDNTVGSSLRCEGNKPPPTGSGNVVTKGKLEGQCEKL